MKSSIKNTLKKTALEEQYDASAKAFLSDKTLIAHICKEVVTEVKDYTVEEIVSFLDEAKVSSEAVEAQITGEANESTEINEGRVTFDIVCDLNIPTEEKVIKILIDLEAQKESSPGYDLVKRGFFYCARLLSRQLGREFAHSNYDNIKKVYSIWVCMNEKGINANTVTRYSIVHSDIIGEYVGESKGDVMEVIMIRLGKEVSDETNVTQMLGVIFTEKMKYYDKIKVLKERYEFEFSEEGKEELNTMCNLSLGFRERGIEEGIKEGQTTKLLSVVKNMVEDGVDDELIMKYTEASKEEILKIREELGIYPS